MKRARIFAVGLLFAVLVGGVATWRRWKDGEVIPAQAVGADIEAPSDSRAESVPPLLASRRDEIADSPPRSLHITLALRRFPDDVQLDTVAVRIEPPAAGADGWHVTDSAGVIRFDAPWGVTALNVQAVGFEPARFAVRPDVYEERLALTPSSGLFGRVVDAHGEPVIDAEVAVERTLVRATRIDFATRRNPATQIDRRQIVFASVRSNRAGWYYLPCDTRNEGRALSVSARARQGFASAEVELPREPSSALSDLTLSPANVLVVRVVDERGGPIQGALVSSDKNPSVRAAGRTDADGTVVCAAPLLPASFLATAPGWLLKDIRIGEVSMGVGALVETCDAPLALVLAETRGVRLCVIEAASRSAIVKGTASVQFVRENALLAENRAELDPEGMTWIAFTDHTGKPVVESPDLVRVKVQAPGHAPETAEFPWSTLDEYQCVEIPLTAEPGSAIRGRVVRAGVPVPNVQLGLSLTDVQSGAIRRYVRGSSDGSGRFSIRWEAGSTSDLATLFLHDGSGNEFGFVGPMDAFAAAAQEHVLDLVPARRVPAVLRNVVRDGDYRYFVSLPADSGSVRTTPGGYPLEIHSDGEARTTLALPADRRTLVTIGYSTGDVLHPSCSATVEVDPSRTDASVEFDVQTRFVSVSGRVAGLDTDHLSRACVGFRPSGEPSVRLVPVRTDGTFVLPNVPLGSGMVFLVVHDVEASATVLARIPVELAGDLDNFVVAPDATSLPERVGQDP